VSSAGARFYEELCGGLGAVGGDGEEGEEDDEDEDEEMSSSSPEAVDALHRAVREGLESRSQLVREFEAAQAAATALRARLVRRAAAALGAASASEASVVCPCPRCRSWHGGAAPAEQAGRGGKRASRQQAAAGRMGSRPLRREAVPSRAFTPAGAAEGGLVAEDLRRFGGVTDVVPRPMPVLEVRGGAEQGQEEGEEGQRTKGP
jgi:hypothetical protein